MIIKKNHLLLILFCFVACFPALAQQASLHQQNPNRTYFVFSPNGKYLAKVTHIKNQADVRILETKVMNTVAHWQIPDFQPQTIQFSSDPPNKLLLADEHRLLVYNIAHDKQKLIFIQPKIENKKLFHVSFSFEGDEIVWATKDSVFKTNLKNKQHRKVASVAKEKATIQSFAILKDNKLAVSLANNKNIYIFFPESTEKMYKILEHKTPVIGVESPEGEILFSLDNTQELLVWDVTEKRVLKRLQLEKTDEQDQVKGFTLDPSRRNLLILSKSSTEGTGKRYALSDLTAGIINPVQQSVFQTPSGKIYANVHIFDKTQKNMDSRQRSVTFYQPTTDVYLGTIEDNAPAEKINPNSLYDLAKIEADNENYEAALEFIRQTPLNDPDFKKSRELKKNIFRQIEIRSALDTAKEQFRSGNLESSRILLENILAKNPDSTEGKRYLVLVEEKLSNKFRANILIFLVIFALIIITSYFVWKYQEKYGVRLKFFSSVKINEEEKEKATILRKQFILKLEETKNILKLAIAKDRTRKHQDQWIELTAKLNMIEKRAKLDDVFLNDLHEQLEKLQAKIGKLSGFEKDKTRSRKESEKTQYSHQQQTTDNDFFKQQKTPPEDKKETHQQSKSNKKRTYRRQSTDSSSSGQRKPPADHEEKKTVQNYYQILGVNQNANATEIKNAYRKKMRQYHPDKHNASDFEWVKQEAARMTQLIQEAYNILSNPQTRKT